MHTLPLPCPSAMPLLPLKDVVVVPQMILPVYIAEDICLKAVEEAQSRDRMIFLSAFSHEHTSAEGDSVGLQASLPPPFDVYDVGTIAAVLRTRKLPDGRTKVLIQGLFRGRILSLDHGEPFPKVQVQMDPDTTSTQHDKNEVETLGRAVKDVLEKLVVQGKSITPDLLLLLEDLSQVGKVADLVASNLGLRMQDAQKILAIHDPYQRLCTVHQTLLRELEVQNLQVRIQHQAKEELSKGQREHYLREQLKAIKNELGELDSKDDIEELRERVMKKGMSPEALQESQKQLRRLERMNPDSSEATITRSYIEWLVDLPWTIDNTPTQVDLSVAKSVLDQDHYGLEKVKDRILEYLAVRKLKPDAKGPILCFAGPPGVGKTSLGRSIAKSLGRKFVRISLGGVRDEAEIRGHRRTYVGAQPGRIVQALKNAGHLNPVMMLDEIDKLSSDFKGDPSSALLEVLDPEQNSGFSDHYISVPIDLSQVIFIANANRLDTIQPALRDRLEIIEVSGYSEEEKCEIARLHIVPKSLEQHGLSADLTQFQDAAISLLVNSYTRESGLRNLEKQVSQIVRKIARSFAEIDEKGKDRKSIKVTPKLTREYLGEEKYASDPIAIDERLVGVAVGLAYTQYGGETLSLEVNLVPGKGGVTLTGQLGDVMKESAQTALSFVRARAQEFGIAVDIFTNQDIHIHIPSGAVPKDGPSAGVTIAVALISALTGKPARQDVAMTGEITLHGRILPVGGLREKILAALLMGITRVCIPEKNRGAIQELPISIRRKVDIQFVNDLNMILDLVLATDAAIPRSPSASKRALTGTLSA